MADTDANVADLELWDGTTWKLRGWPGIRRWFGQIEGLWRPFEDVAVPSDPVNVKGNVLGRLNDMKARIANAEKSGGTPRDFAPELSSAANRGWGPCHPDSALGQLMSDLSSDASVEAALFAYAIIRGYAQPSHAQNLEHIRGMLGAAYPGWSAASAGHKRLANERTNFRNAARSLSEEVERSEAERARHWESLLRESTVGMVGWARRRSRAWRDTLARWRAHKATADAQLASLEATYREKLSLMAPVEYWNAKAQKHKRAESFACLFVVVFFALALPALAIMFGAAGWYLLNHVDDRTPSGLYFVASAGLATTAGVLFWIGRLLTKLYLSQHHLRQDAEERAVMTTTYLALTAENAAADADRSIILNALFRPTADGIVKEEGSLDANLASVISRFATRQ